jgi:hypothetical protein
VGGGFGRLDDGFEGKCAGIRQRIGTDRISISSNVFIVCCLNSKTT